MALRSTKAVGTIATIQLMSQMAPLDIRGTAESQSVIGRLGVFAPPSSRRSASGAVSGSVDCRALGGCSAGTSLSRSPRGVPPAGGSVRAGVEAAGGWTGHVGRRMTQVWRAPGDATLWTCVCRVAATAWTACAGPERWLVAGVHLPNACCHLSRLARLGSAQRQRTKMCSGAPAGSAGSGDTDRRDASRRSPSTHGMHADHVGRSGWAGGRRGGVVAGDAWLRRARRPGQVPEDAQPKVSPTFRRPLPRTVPAQHAYVPGAHGKSTSQGV